MGALLWAFYFEKRDSQTISDLIIVRDDGAELIADTQVVDKG